MKKLIGISLLALFVCFSSFGQDSSSDKMSRAEMQAQRMAKELNLSQEQIEKKEEIDAYTAEQYKKINQMRQEVMEERAALSQDATDEEREALTEKMSKLRTQQIEVKKEASKKFEAILTAEQMEKYKEMRKAPVNKTELRTQPKK